ncbi:MAG: hypothetical protein KME13_26380 [Myxacorys californica WJT36-NPBG1]|nr:hypothetical protein [Myxacorys californica WJT36-NPBG1]
MCIWYPPDVSVFSDEFEEVLNEVLAIAVHFSGTEARTRRVVLLSETEIWTLDSLVRRS